MRYSLERKIAQSAAAMLLAAACSVSEKTKMPVPTRIPTATTLYVPPTETPQSTVSHFDGPVKATLQPFPTRTAVPTYTPTASRTLSYLPINTPDFRVSSKCEIKPKVPQETIDWLYRSEIFYGNTGRKVMMLTFDDYGNEYQVGKILDNLAKYGAKGSFFVNAPMFVYAPNAVKRIVNEGHVLAIHSNNHDIFPKLTPDQIDADFCNFLSASEKVLPGYQYKYFRFPYGSRNEVVRWQVASWGLMNVMWSDVSGGVSALSSYNEVVARSNNGKIILMHMGRPGDVEGSEMIIAKLVELGYSLESIETGLR